MRRFYESEAGQGQHNDKTLKEFKKKTPKIGNTKSPKQKSGEEREKWKGTSE